MYFDITEFPDFKENKRAGNEQGKCVRYRGG
jgi:hypothetical protein